MGKEQDTKISTCEKVRLDAYLTAYKKWTPNGSMTQIAVKTKKPL